MNLKFNARVVDEIEQTKKMPIEKCIEDTSVRNLALFIQKGLIDDNGVHGVSQAVAMTKIDEYLLENDKTQLSMDIMEALIQAGFLSREIDTQLMKKMQKEMIEQAMKDLSKQLKSK